MFIKDYFGRITEYHTGSYNKYNNTEQYIRISDGCPNNCPYCYAPQELTIYEIPEIVRNQVIIIDDNLTSKPEAIKIIKELGKKRVNGKVVYYELVCGIDFRHMSLEMAEALKNSRFINLRLAWDWGYRFQKKIKASIDMLVKVGYEPRNIMVFILSNWLIPYSECYRKLDLLKIWNVKVADCYYDNQVSPNIIPIHWKKSDIESFRKDCRKHNQLVNFRIDPEYLIDDRQKDFILFSGA